MERFRRRFSKKKRHISFAVPQQMMDFVSELPKVELHVHLPGAYDLRLIYDSTSVKDEKSFEEFKDECICRDKRSLQAMLHSFEVFQKLVKSNYTLIEALAYRFVEDQAVQNVLYTEVRYSPHLLGDDTEAGFAAVTRGLRRACQDHEVIVNQILCCIDLKPGWSDEVVEMANTHRNDFPCAVVGIDLAAGEDHFVKTREEHLAAIDKANQYGLNVVMHAGEIGGVENVLAAITKFGAKRIGHGYALADIIKAGDYADHPCHLAVLENKVHFEVCPSSSYETGGWRGEDAVNKQWPRHPLRNFIAAGYSVSLNTDDPSVFETTINREIEIVLNKMNLSRGDIIRMMRNGIDASFGTQAHKDFFMVAMRNFIKNEGP